MREADVARAGGGRFQFHPPADALQLVHAADRAEPVPGQNTWLPNGFKLVDDLLTWCEAHQIHLILDMHGCPGGQGRDQPISISIPRAVAVGECHQPHQTRCLVAGNRCPVCEQNRIGGYDLINEPNWTFENNSNINGCNDQTNAPLRQLLQDITAAIRQVDTNHLLILEGNCWAGNYNGVLPPWDDNLVISFHKYWGQPTAASLQPWVDKRNQWNMPVWLGESGENSNEWFRDVVRYAEQANIGWAWWPWKKIGTIAGPVIVQNLRVIKPSSTIGTTPVRARPPTTRLTVCSPLAQTTRYENCVCTRCA